MSSQSTEYNFQSDDTDMLELGRIHFNPFVTENVVKDWERIRLGQGNKILLECYNDLNVSWGARVEYVLEWNGMLNFVVNDSESVYHFVYTRYLKTLWQFSSKQFWNNEEKRKQAENIYPI